MTLPVKRAAPLQSVREIYGGFQLRPRLADLSQQCLVVPVRRRKNQLDWALRVCLDTCYSIIVHVGVGQQLTFAINNNPTCGIGFLFFLHIPRRCHFGGYPCRKNCRPLIAIVDQALHVMTVPFCSCWTQLSPWTSTGEERSSAPPGLPLSTIDNTSGREFERGTVGIT